MTLLDLFVAKMKRLETHKKCHYRPAGFHPASCGVERRYLIFSSLHIYGSLEERQQRQWNAWQPCVIDWLLVQLVRRLFVSRVQRASGVCCLFPSIFFLFVFFQDKMIIFSAGANKSLLQLRWVLRARGFSLFILARPDTGTDLCATVTAIQRNEGCGYHCHTSLDERLHPKGPWGAFFDTCLMMRAVDRTCKSRCLFYL